MKILEKSALAAKESGILIGALLFSKGFGELEFLAVHPQYCRLGAATALVRHMFALFLKAVVFPLKLPGR